MAGMDTVPRELLQAAYKRNPIYLLKIPLHFGIWAALTWVLYATQHHPLAIPIGIVVSFAIANLVRGLGAVAHDAVHGSCSRSKLVSYLIALVCWAPTGMSVTLYTNYHLHHHKIANTYPDVDNFVVTDYTRNPVLAKLLLLAVYTFAYPLYFLGCMARYVKRLSALQRVKMNLEILGFWGLMAFFFWVMPGQVFFFFYALPFIFGAILASVTSMIEHYEMLPGEDAYSSRTYGTSAHFTNFLWNNVTYHNEHHKFPGIPFYNLRRFHVAAYPYYDERVKSACHPSIVGIALELYGRILKLDIAKLDERYRGLNKEAERQKMMAMNGIQPGVTA
ncbi:omega-3 fatty acid desaturase [Sorangium cellulosum]|uniref:Omega-3 fatty acid desaturase n=1 Tax=Sorangium cellulosum TaxID=56 RepID=A0A150T2M6_SORCE|nr:omega-3 fatty acid desaturase [Sorangium cellulosum]KYF98931.1 omega-3 fatty acid desaturase [Sorangium cellulosum]